MQLHQDLLKRYQTQQDPEAFRELVLHYSPLVYRTALKITRNATDAEDITQECFWRLAQKAETIHFSVAGWLRGTATYLAKNWQRTLQRRKFYEQELSATFEEALTSPEIRQELINSALQSLPEHLREPVIRHYLEGRPQEELSEELGIHQSTVSRRIQQGLDLLRKQLEPAEVWSCALENEWSWLEFFYLWFKVYSPKNNLF